MYTPNPMEVRSYPRSGTSSHPDNIQLLQVSDDPYIKSEMSRLTSIDGIAHMPANQRPAGRGSLGCRIATLLCAVVIIRAASSVKTRRTKLHARTADAVVSPIQVQDCTVCDLRLLFDAMYTIMSFELGRLDSHGQEGPHEGGGTGTTSPGLHPRLTWGKGGWPLAILCLLCFVVMVCG